MQYNYHRLRLTLEILAVLHVPRDSEVWIWVLQLKLLSSGEAQKIARRCLGPISSHQTLPTYSTSHCRARKLLNSHGRPWTLTMSKQVTCPNNQRLLACLSIVAWVLAHSWVCCPDSNGPWGFNLSSVPMNISPHKNKDLRSSSCGNPFLGNTRNVPGIYVSQRMVFSGDT